MKSHRMDGAGRPFELTNSLLKREAYSFDLQGLGERVEEAMTRRSLCTATDCTQVAGGLRTWRSRSPTAIRAGIRRAEFGEPRFSDPSVTFDMLSY